AEIDHLILQPGDLDYGHYSMAPAGVEPATFLLRTTRSKPLFHIRVIV
ncbi:4004_t:CDS:1, partial [Ambispora leptoticha]